MPCRSDYMEPNEREIESRLVASLLAYVLQAMNISVPTNISSAALNSYGSAENCDVFTARLCSLIKGMNKKQRERIVYNAKNPVSRRLADWWENHQTIDKKREAKEKADAAREKIREAALAKLSPKEKEALGV
jgi:hypothetical protein